MPAVSSIIAGASAALGLGGELYNANLRSNEADYARKVAAKNEVKAKEAAALKAKQAPDTKTKVGASSTEDLSKSSTKGTSTRKSSNGVSGLTVSASTIGGL